MKTKIKALVVIVATALSANDGFANDCGWSSLTAAEQGVVDTGKPVMRTSDDTLVKEKSRIDMWAYSANPSLTEAVANWYDESSFYNAGGVADITLADGELPSNNPVIFQVTPKASNPFGPLYQPFLFAGRVRVDGDGFNVTVDYLTSPGLIKHVFNDMCFARVNGKVLVRFLSTITDSDNPMLSRESQAFGWPVRKMLWGKIFSEGIARSSVVARPEVVENFKKALLGKFGE